MKLVKSFVLVIGLLCVAYFVGATDYQWQLDSNHDGTSEVSIDTGGDMIMTGYVTIGSVTSPSLPTSGYGAGTILFNSTNKMLYFSTGTVTSVSSWVVVH